MSVIPDLIQMKLLDKKAFQECLRQLISKRDIDLKSCETLLALFNACDFDEEFDIQSDESLRKCYSDLLNMYLIPQLNKIINNVDTELPNHFEHFKAIESGIKTLGDETNADSLSKNPSNSMISSFCKNLDQKASEINYLILAPKIVALILAILRKFLLSGNCKSHSDYVDVSGSVLSSSQNAIGLIGEIFDMIGKGLCDGGFESISKCDQHRVKFLSLVFTNFVKDNNWLYANCPELKPCLRGVTEVALMLIQSSHDLDTAAILLNLVIHPFMETFVEERTALVSNLWGIVLSSLTIKDEFIKEETNCNGFLILCFMADHIFECDHLCDIRNDDRFYVVIQFGLVHSDALTRKRSQFLLKRALDFSAASKTDKFSAISSKFFSWDDGDKLNFQDVWNDFFLILETLEEKQSHVIWPVLDKLVRFIECTSKRYIHVTWMLAVFKRIFDHDNKGIKYWGVIKILKLKLSEFMLTKGAIAFINFHLITVLSDYSLYNQEIGQNNHVSGMVSPVGVEFGNFLESMVSGLDSCHLDFFMHSILENIFDGRSWGGIPLFYIMRGLSLIPNTRLWKYEIVKDALVKFEGCLSTQEVCVRSASQCGFLRAVLKHLSIETSLIELCSIIRHFRRKESWCRGTVLWQVLIESMDDFEQNKNVSGMESVGQTLTLFQKSSFSDLCVPAEDIALAVCLLMEKLVNSNSDERSTNKIQKLLNPVAIFLSDCHQRPYIDQQKYVWVLKLLHQMLIISNDVPETCLLSKGVVEHCLLQMNVGFSCVVQLFISNVRTCDQLWDHEMLVLYLDLFVQLNNSATFSYVVKSHYAEIFVLCQELLNENDIFRVFIGILILEHLWQFYFEESSISVKTEMISLTMSKILHNVDGICGNQTEGPCGFNARPSTKFQLEVTRSYWSCMELLLIKVSEKKDYFVMMGYTFVVMRIQTYSLI